MKQPMFIFLLLVLVGGLSFAANCGGEYSGSGDWYINSSIICDDGPFTVTGDIEVGNSSGGVASEFFADLDEAAQNISFAFQDSAFVDNGLIDEAFYTNNLIDLVDNVNFSVIVNLVTTEIHGFFNNTNTTYFLAFDLDNNDETGMTDINDDFGFDLYVGMSPTFGIGIQAWNATADSPFGPPLNGEGWFQSLTEGDTSVINHSWDANLTVNYTVTFDNSTSPNVIEFTLNLTSWEQVPIVHTNIAGPGDYDEYYLTLFDQDPAAIQGNLTLVETELQLDGSFALEYGFFNMTDSSIILNDSGQFNETVFDFADNFIITDSIIGILNSTNMFGWGAEADVCYIDNLTMNGSGYTDDENEYDFGNVYYCEELTVINSQLGRCGDAGGVGCITLQDEGYDSVLIDNNVFHPVIPIYKDIALYGTTPEEIGDIIISNNHFFSYVDFDGASGIILYNNTFEATGSLLLQANWSGDEEVTELNIIINNDFMSGGINYWSDNTTFENTVMYNNTFGTVTWELTNLSMDGVASFEFGSDVIISNGGIVLVEQAGLENYNESIALEFRGLITPSVQLEKDSVRCDDTTTCNISYDSVSGILVANVSGLGSYEVLGSLPPGYETALVTYAEQIPVLRMFGANEYAIFTVSWETSRINETLFMGITSLYTALAGSPLTIDYNASLFNESGYLINNDNFNQTIYGVDTTLQLLPLNFAAFIQENYTGNYTAALYFQADSAVDDYLEMNDIYLQTFFDTSSAGNEVITERDGGNITTDNGNISFVITLDNENPILLLLSGTMLSVNNTPTVITITNTDSGWVSHNHLETIVSGVETRWRLTAIDNTTNAGPNGYRIDYESLNDTVEFDTGVGYITMADTDNNYIGNYYGNNESINFTDPLTLTVNYQEIDSVTMTAYNGTGFMIVAEGAVESITNQYIYLKVNDSAGTYSREWVAESTGNNDTIFISGMDNYNGFGPGVHILHFYARAESTAQMYDDGWSIVETVESQNISFLNVPPIKGAITVPTAGATLTGTETITWTSGYDPLGTTLNNTVALLNASYDLVYLIIANTTLLTTNYDTTVAADGNYYIGAQMCRTGYYNDDEQCSFTPLVLVTIDNTAPTPTPAAAAGSELLGTLIWMMVLVIIFFSMFANIWPEDALSLTLVGMLMIAIGITISILL